MIYFRHEKFRKYQEELVQDTKATIEQRSILLANAPMGLGKTDAVLSPAITKAIEEGLTVFFLTPKISQHKIALDVVDGINKKYGLKIKAVDLVGRRYMCIHPSLMSLDHDNFYTMCKKLREDELCRYFDNAVGYSKTKAFEASLLFKKFNKSRDIFYHGEVWKYGKEKEACPYELLVKASHDANIIIADYYHLFIKGVREAFLRKSKKSIEKSIVIVDEAHNLAPRVRNHLSKTINDYMLKRIDKEMEFIGVEKLNMASAFSKWVEKELRNANEKIIGKEKFNSFLSNWDEIEGMIEYMEEVGFEYSKASSKSSNALRFSNFLKVWNEDTLGEIRIIKRNPKSFSLSKRLLDPSSATSLLNDTYSSILMSGTLTPLEMYKDILGIKKARMKSYSSPFPQKNRLLMISKGLTTRYSKRNENMYKSYAEEIDLLFKESPGGVAVFFPSFKVLEDVSTFTKSRPLYKQKASMNPMEAKQMIENFKKSKSLLFGVQGGSLSEGVDFNKGEIKVLVIAGLALEEMKLETKALIEYYDEKFGKGMDYGYVYPAITKALQSSGRAIRNEKDKAVIIFMDERFKWANYFKLLPEENFIITKNPHIYINRFFNSKKFSYA